ncbi:TetR/AcrR family transcriptional regulator [Paenibacillus glucanolyticus]|uniref:TetR/AcrR family transcriptional regulator n=1 Tax=Paenibacillus glucanolyticus TaxID=59843 RepID=UPI00096FE721|nr:TetR/AcrR family transcriptional regulator [Paenibacillus glucanolyticus]OMF78759.1 TetR family transcriptional regulator [Paenibacillus glucanolyticus]
MSKKREQLLEQSERLFDKHGFHTVGLKQIIKQSSVALMTLYNHFDSKEDLILEVLKRRETRYLNSLNDALDKKTNAELAQALAKAHMDWIRSYDSNGCMFLRAKEEFSLEQSENSEIVGFAEAHKNHLLTFFQEKGLDIREAIRLVLLFEGATALAEVFEVETVAQELAYSVEKLFS